MDWVLDLWPYLAALLPTAGLLYLFYVIMKHIIEGDRRERAAVRQWEQEREDRRRNSDGNVHPSP